MKLYQDKTSVLVITHYRIRTEKGEDTDQRLIAYLKNKVNKVVHITNPFPYAVKKDAYLAIYENGKKKVWKVQIPGGPDFLQYIYHFFVTYHFLMKSGFKYEICIAMENLSFIYLYPLRKLGFIKRLIYYSIDFVPVRFEDKFLNWIYRTVFSVANKFSDRNWVLAKEQIKGARNIGIKKGASSPFFLVPIGYETKRIEILPTEKIDYFNIAYAGGLREALGPELPIKALPYLIKKIPKIKLTIIGAGVDTKKLKDLSKSLKLGKHVDFVGYMEDFNDMTKMLTKKSIGLAPYKPIPGSFSFYSDPSKIKLYMVCGLPVITTSVTTMASQVIKTGSGIVINYNENSLVSAVYNLLSNPKRYTKFRNKAIKLSEEFDINNILEKAIRNIPD